MTNQIFLSYRRDDSEDATGRLHDLLVAEFDDEQIWMDVQDIPYGDEFQSRIDAAIQAASVICVVIGSEWVSNPRLHRDDDTVRFEVRKALEARALVVPVLLGDTPMPTRAQLPKGIRRLQALNAARLRPETFVHDTERLIQVLARHVEPRKTFWSRAQRLRDHTTTRMLVAGVAALFLAVVAFVTILDLNDRFRGGAEIEPLAGDVNVAVAKFATLGRDGSVEESSEMTSFSLSVADSVRKDLVELEARLAVSDTDPDLVFAMVGPAEVGSLSGTGAQRRYRQAIEFASEREIHAVLYALLDIDNGELVPEMHVTADELTVSDGQLAGRWQLGEPIPVDGSITSPVVRAQARSDLTASLASFPEIALGLSHFGASNYDVAKDVFLRVLQGGDESEIVQLFLANSHLRLGEFDEAEMWYRTALDQRPEYSRALIGLASIAYQRSQNGCTSAIDDSGVQESIELFRSAEQSGDQPAGAAIGAKASYGIARGLLCLSQANVADRWTEAARSYQMAIDTEAAEQPPLDLLSESWGGLGLVDLLGGDRVDRERVGPIDAIDAFTKAIELNERARDEAGINTRERIADWYGLIGYTHWCAGDTDRGEAAYQQAITMTRIDDKRTRLQGRPTNCP